MHRAGLVGRGTKSAATPVRPESSLIAATVPVSATASSASTAAQWTAVAGKTFLPSVSTLNDDDRSTFIALRYDKTYVLFRLGDNGDFYIRPEDEPMLHSLPEPVAEYRELPDQSRTQRYGTPFTQASIRLMQENNGNWKFPQDREYL